MLTQISGQAKWVIYVFIFFIVVGLLWMDVAGLKTGHTQAIAVVNGREVNAEMFRRELQNRTSAEKSGLTEEKSASIRQELLSSFIRQQLVSEQIEELGLVGSVFEMQKELFNNPPPVLTQQPVFMTDSVFDPAKYQRWLANDSTYDLPFMRQMELYLKKEKIPAQQLQVLVAASGHVTDIEARFNIQRRENQYRIDYVSVPFDSFMVDPKTVPATEIDAWIKANPDSLIAPMDFRSAKFLALPIVPSAQDDKLIRDYTDSLIKQIREGGDFAELAKFHSEDEGSAQNGGVLGDFMTREQLVKPFADAAFALNPGEMAPAPVRSEFGYHIIKLIEKKVENNVEKAKIAHILFKVIPGTETVDSVQNLLEKARKEIQDGETIEAAAKKLNLTVDSSGWLQKNQPVAKLGYVSGLSGFLFSKQSKDEKVTEVLQNDKWVVVAVKSGEIKAGKNAPELFREGIARKLAMKQQLAQADAYLKSALPQIKSMTALNAAALAAYPKILIDSAVSASLDSYVPRLGYASAGLQKVIKQPANQWGDVVEGDRSVVAAKVVPVIMISEQDLKSKINEEIQSMERYLGPSMMNEYVSSLEAGAKIEDNSEMYFRD